MMRKLWPLLLLAGAALAAPLTLDPSVRYEFTDCASGGSAAQSLTAGRKYLMRVTDESVFVCLAATGSTCSSGGEKFPAGTVVLINVTDSLKSVSCRSANSTGDVIFTKAD